MIEFETMAAVLSRLEEEPASIVYISQPGCSVCVAVKPQLRSRYEGQVPILHLDGAKLPEVASTFSVMTAPAVLVFSHGKEMQRQASFIDYKKIDQLLAELAQSGNTSYDDLFDQLEDQ